MAESDLLISPSLWECWPNVVLEALSQSLPVLATPVGGHVELVDAGTTGWLASCRDEADIATALEQLLDRRDEASALAEGGAPRARFEELTSPEVVRESYARLAGQGSEAGSAAPDLTRARLRRRPLLQARRASHRDSRVRSRPDLPAARGDRGERRIVPRRGQPSPRRRRGPLRRDSPDAAELGPRARPTGRSATKPPCSARGMSRARRPR
jgi:hypothetical protein